MAKKIVIGLLIILMLAGAVGALGYFTQGFKDWTFKPDEGDKVTEQSKLLKDFAEGCDFSFTFGEGDNAFTISSDTEAIYLDDLISPGKHGVLQVAADAPASAFLPIEEIKGLSYDISGNDITDIFIAFSRSLDYDISSESTFNIFHYSYSSWTETRGFLFSRPTSFARISENPFDYFLVANNLDEIIASGQKYLGSYHVSIKYNEKLSPQKETLNTSAFSAVYNYYIPVFLK